MASLVQWLSVDPWTMPFSETARILAVETVASKSHWCFMSSVLRSLTEAGHTVTVFTQFPDGDRTNYTEVDTSHDFPMKLDMDVWQTIRDTRNPFKFINITFGVTRFYCDAIYGNHQELVDLIKKKNYGMGKRYIH